MKLIKYLSICALFTLTALSLSSCGGGNEATDTAGKEYTSAYICPMHCEGSGSDAAGTCPACKMDYVVNKEHPQHKDAHNHDGHDHSHDGHNHEGHNH